MRAILAALAILTAPAVAAGRCETPDEAAALHAAALQQEMMVAAFQCADVASYNNFVLAHRPALQQADRALMAYFQRIASNPFDAYNLYKTELANASSLRFSTDRAFCARMAADFRAAARFSSLDQVLAEVPYTVDTGSAVCPWAARAIAPEAVPPPKKRIRHRTWLGRLVDWLF
jgi:hypothetical protein